MSGSCYKLGNVIFVLAAVYFAYALYSLYRHTVPAIPDVYNDDGSMKPALISAWNDKSGNLELSMSLYAGKDTIHSHSFPLAYNESSVELFRLTDLSFDWNLSLVHGYMANSLNTKVHILRKRSDPESIVGLVVVCDIYDNSHTELEQCHSIHKRNLHKILAAIRDNEEELFQSVDWSDVIAAPKTAISKDMSVLTVGVIMSAWAKLQTLLGLITPVEYSYAEYELSQTSFSNGGSPSITVNPVLLSVAISPSAVRVAESILRGRNVHLLSHLHWLESSSADSGYPQASQPIPTVGDESLVGMTQLIRLAPYKPKRLEYFLWYPILTRFLQCSETFSNNVISNSSTKGQCPTNSCPYKLLTLLHAPPWSHVFSSLPLSTLRTLLLSGKSSSSLVDACLSLPEFRLGPLPLEWNTQFPPEGTVVPHWTATSAFRLFMDTKPYPKYELPQDVQSFLRRDSSREKYLPQLLEMPLDPVSGSFLPISRSLVSLPLAISFSSLSFNSLRFLRLMGASLDQQRAFGATEKEIDDMVGVLMSTPLWLLGLLMVVSTVHLLLDMLSIRADVGYWSKVKTLKGVSVRSLAWQAISQFIILAFLVRSGSSLMVTVPQACIFFVSFWKVFKASGVVFGTKYLIFPVARYDRNLAATAWAGKASSYDREAMSLLAQLIFPVISVVCCFTFIYYSWPTWLDWILHTLVTCVYTGGFILMTPQLWVNYRLKSVPPLPWTVFGYKFMNTIIDDVFAAILKNQPLIHRLSVFRDDIIFVIYMIQRWKYKVDYERPAESIDDEPDEFDGEGGKIKNE